MEYPTYYLEKLELFQLTELAKFIVIENFNHHCNGNLPVNYNNDITEIFEEEKKYYNSSSIFIAKGILGEIQGAIRILKWNYTDVLPLQKIFNISPVEVMRPGEEDLPIYHIGRFAIKKDLKDINLFKKLMVCAISPICERKEGIAFAECDSKLLRIINLLGIKTRTVGESVNYLGSETIPVSMEYSGLIDFYIKNKSLVASELVSGELEEHFLLNQEANNTQPYNYSLI